MSIACSIPFFMYIQHTHMHTHMHTGSYTYLRIKSQSGLLLYALLHSYFHLTCGGIFTCGSCLHALPCDPQKGGAVLFCRPSRLTCRLFRVFLALGNAARPLRVGGGVGAVFDFQCGCWLGRSTCVHSVTCAWRSWDLGGAGMRSEHCARWRLGAEEPGLGARRLGPSIHHPAECRQRP